MKHQTIMNLLLVLATASFFLTNQVGGDEWAALKGQYIYDGPAPKAKFIVPTKDVPECGKQQIPDEYLVVNAKNGGIANIMLYLHKKPSKISPSHQKDDDAKVTFDNAACRFEPRVQLVRTTQTLLVGNKDAVSHNVNMTVAKNAIPNQLVAALSTWQVQFNDPETRPVVVKCNIHPWMTGYLLVKDHPYIAKTDKDGRFEMKDLPTGEQLEVRVWHPAGWVRKIKGGNIKFGRKGFKITLEKDFDIGEVKVDPVFFED